MGSQAFGRLRRVRAPLVFATAGTVLAAGLVAGPGARPGAASNHIDAPSQVLDRQLDVSDLYLFTSPDKPDTVTMICNWSGFQLPIVDGILPFYRFVDKGHYDFNIDNDGDGKPEFTYRFDFKNTDGRPDPPPTKGGTPAGLDAMLPKGPQTFQKPPNPDGGIARRLAQLPDGEALRQAQAEYARRTRAADQAYQAARAGGGRRSHAAQEGSNQKYTLELRRPGKAPQVLAKDVPTAPWGRQGRQESVVSWKEGGGGKAYAGPDSDPFFWWFPTNVQTIALELPKKLLALNDNPTANPVVGAWTHAYRESIDLKTGKTTDVQRTRQGLSGFSSVVLPLQMRDHYHLNSTPATDHTWKDMRDWVKTGSTGSLFGVAFLPVTGLINVGKQLDQMFLYGIAKSNGPIKRDLNAHILNKDVDPAKIQPADEMRLNMMTPLSKDNKRHGVLDGDLQGYPNGRRLTDDVFTAFARITAGEPAFSTPLGLISIIPVSGVLAVPKDFPYQNPPW